MQAVCLGPTQIDLNVAPEFSYPISLPKIAPYGLGLFINGVSIIPVGVYIQTGCITIVSPQSIKPQDEVYLRLIGGGSDSSSPQQNLLSSLIPVAICFNSVKQSVHPLGLGTDFGVIDSGFIQPWFNGTYPSSQPASVAEFTILTQDESGSSITRNILNDLYPAKSGELFTLSVDFFSPSTVFGNVSLYSQLTPLMGNQVSLQGNSDWQTLTTTFTPSADSYLWVSCSLSAESKDNKIFLRNVLLTSNWRGVLLNDPLTTTMGWTLSGEAYPGSSKTPQASWYSTLNTDFTNSVAILSQYGLRLEDIPS